MANLIIKPSTNGQLILKDEGDSAAITVATDGNTTLAGTANNLGTVTAGTLGSAVVFNDAHKDIDIDADCWMRYATASQDGSSNQTIVWDGVVKMGSNVTYDGTSDYIQVAKAGWYWVTVQYSHLNKEDQVVELWVRQSQTTGASPTGTTNTAIPRIYQQTCNDGTGYFDAARSGFLYLAATDRVDVHGTFHLYGTALVKDAMNFFTGVRVGT